MEGGGFELSVPARRNGGYNAVGRDHPPPCWFFVAQPAEIRHARPVLVVEGCRTLSGKAGQLQAYRLEAPTRISIIGLGLRFRLAQALK